MAILIQFLAETFPPAENGKKSQGSNRKTGKTCQKRAAVSLIAKNKKG